MNPASTPRCPYRPLPRVKEEERARAPVFHRRVRENTPRVDGTRHEAHGNVHHVSRPKGRRGGATLNGGRGLCSAGENMLDFCLRPACVLRRFVQGIIFWKILGFAQAP